MQSGDGYKGVMRRGSKYGWKYEDGKTSRHKSGFSTAEDAAYDYDEFLIGYIGGHAETNQSLGILKPKQVASIRQRIEHSKPQSRYKGRAIGAAGFKGVSFVKSKAKPYKAQASDGQRRITIGTYATAEEAARAYDDFVSRHMGNDAITNASLGLIPAAGGESAITATVTPPKPPQPASAAVASISNADHHYKQPGTRDTMQVYTPFSVEDERAAQIIAAQSMQDIDDEDSHSAGPADNNAMIRPGTPSHSLAPSTPPAANQELLIASDADRLRAQAQALLQQAAEIETGNVKRQAAARLDALSNITLQMQNTMMQLIDVCAEIENQIQGLRDYLK